MTAPARTTGHNAEDPRARPFAERMRRRVGQAAAGLFLVYALFLGVQSGLNGLWALLIMDFMTGLLAAVALLLFRRGRSLTLPSAILITWMFGAMLLVTLIEGGLYFTTSATQALLALLALYLLGPRLGMIFVALAALQVGLAFAVHHSGWFLARGHLESPDAGLSAVAAACGIALIGLLGYLYELAQKRTLGELEDALISTEHNERQLEALIESSTSAICSLDTSLRLITCNHAFARALARDGAPRPGAELAQVVAAAQMERWRPHLTRVLAGAGSASFEEPPDQDGSQRETVLHPVVSGGEIIGVTLFSRDITARKRAEAEMRKLHQELVALSRQAGMAAVASEMLHNAGNVLNSVGVSVAMLDTQVQRLKGGHLARTVALLEENAGHLDEFLRDDPRGRRVLDILRALGAHFESQEQHLAAELGALRDNVDHLTRVIRAQQSHARSLGVVEEVTVDELVDAAMSLQMPPWSQLGVTVERAAAPVPRLRTDKHKVLEILVNLLGNARHALGDSARPDKRLTIRAEAAAPDRVRIHVEDNGVGIDPAHAEKLFQLGFTTKPSGSGLGLHSAANAAQQLGGALRFHSDGPGRGAVFTLELPLDLSVGLSAGLSAGPPARAPTGADT